MAQKSRRYAAIFYVCLLIAVVLVGIMLFSEENGRRSPSASEAIRISLPSTSSTNAATTLITPASARMVIRWTEEQLCDILSDALESVVPSAEITAVTLQAPDSIQIVGKLPKEIIYQLLEESNIAITAAAEVAIRLAPKTIDLCIGCSARSQYGTILLTPILVSIEDVEIPCSVLPTSWVSALNKCMKTALAKQQCTALELDIQNGSLCLDCEVGS